MRKLLNIVAIFFLTNLWSQEIANHEVMIFSPEGDIFTIEIDSNETVGELANLLQDSYNMKGQFAFHFLAHSPQANTKANKKSRDYLAAVTESEKKDIAYIVNTLGMSSLYSIKKAKSSLKNAGARIDHVHPLRFLMCVFTDEKMKASIAAMEGRAWVWSEFVSGIAESLETEMNRGNMKSEFIADFSSKVGIDPNMITSSIESRHWTQLIVSLIRSVPRDANVNRYDI